MMGKPIKMRIMGETNTGDIAKDRPEPPAVMVEATTTAVCRTTGEISKSTWGTGNNMWE